MHFCVSVREVQYIFGLVGSGMVKKTLFVCACVCVYVCVCLSRERVKGEKCVSKVNEEAIDVILFDKVTRI